MPRVPISRVTVEPAIEPVTVAEVKANAFIESDTSYDPFIEKQLIPTARVYVEEIAERSLITQTRAQYHDCLDTTIRVRYGPVQSITSITYKDSAAASQTLTASLYTVDTASIPGRVVQAYNATYPSSIEDTNSVVVTAVCGYGTTAASVPIIYRRAIILLSTFWHNNRAAFACGESDDATMMALQRMLAIGGAVVSYA